MIKNRYTVAEAAREAFDGVDGEFGYFSHKKMFEAGYRHAIEKLRSDAINGTDYREGPKKFIPTALADWLEGDDT